MTGKNMLIQPLTNNERQRRHRARGDVVHCVITEEDARAELEALLKVHVTMRKAITVALANSGRLRATLTSGFITG